MTPLERAARALAVRHHEPLFNRGDSGYTPDYSANLYWRDYVAQARTVIAAIREPTCRITHRGQAVRYDSAWSIGAIWREMIDAIDEEG